jgi:hypothetical protein
MWKNIVQTDRPEITIWRMGIAFCIPKATNTHSEYVVLTVFPLQQWLYEYDSMPVALATAYGRLKESEPKL